MKSLQEQIEILQESKRGGRHLSVTEKQLLEAIGRYQTTSIRTLAKKLDVSKSSIHRRLKNIPPELIDAILQQATENELKPEQQRWEGFRRIDVIQEYYKALIEKKKVKPRYARKQVRRLWRICQNLNKHPSKLTMDDAHRIEKIIEEGKARVLTSVTGVRRTMRAWLMYIGVTSEQLKMEGLKCPSSEGGRATIKLTEEERIRIMQTINRLVKENFDGKVGNFVTQIPFKDKPELAEAMKIIPSFAYYTGTRKAAMLQNARWENVTWDDNVTIIKILDKGNIEWPKKIALEFLEVFKQYHEKIGKPKEGRIFPFTENELTSFFYRVYEEAQIPQNKWKGMPIHIWRHTACQDMLDATNRNFEMTARILGWKSVDTMRKHYGEVSEEDIKIAVLEAMGKKIERKNKEFHFCQDIDLYRSFFNSSSTNSLSTEILTISPSLTPNSLRI